MRNKGQTMAAGISEEEGGADHLRHREQRGREKREEERKKAALV
jgi:hypothetical protein